MDKYSSQKLMQLNQKQLGQILSKYKQQFLPLWKLGLFMGYNAIALIGMAIYGIKLRGKKVQPSIIYRKKFTVQNLFSSGVKHASIMIGIYLAGLYSIFNNVITFEMLRKLTEIQSSYYSFGLKFDPNYQEYLLWNRMRKYNISQKLIQQIKQQLDNQKKRLISIEGMLPDTIKKIEEAQQLFKRRFDQLK